MNAGTLRRTATWLFGSRPRSLHRLTRAVMGGSSSAHLISSLLHQAIHEGELVERADHSYLPASVGRNFEVPGLSALWAEAGFVPFRVKRCHLPSDQIRALAIVFDVLNNHPELRAVPQWISDGWALSLYLEDAVDLRARDAVHYADAAAVHDICLTSLQMFADRDTELREALRANDCADPPRFPVARRYQSALVDLAEVLDSTSGIDLPPVLPENWEYGRWTLFCDPKPANFLVAAGQRERLDRGAQTFRIDLDLLYYQCPLALQLVLALFAHPVAFREPGSLGDQVSALRGVAHTTGKAMNIGTDDIDAMLLYHLLRNFATAAKDLREGKKSARGKALGMAPVLCSMLQVLPTVDAPQTVRALQEWMNCVAA